MLLYLHGFNSSPQSHKARVTAQWLAASHPQEHFLCPQLSPYPRQVMAALEALTAVHASADALVIGSSMGGFYATWLAERWGCRAVLVNPAVTPWLGRDYLLGEQINYHTGERYPFEPHHLDDFRLFAVEPVSRPQNLWVLLQTGDEVLDYRLAADYYRQCRVTVESGGDHSFQGYEHHLPAIYRFWRQGA